MSVSQTMPERDRIVLALIGAGAGLTLWAMLEYLPEVTENTRVLLGAVTLTGGFFAILLAALGPLRGQLALWVAALGAVPASGLLVWASLRYDTIGDFLKTGHVIVAYAMLLSLPVPFLIARASAQVRWWDYPALFDHAWQIIVRYLAAGVFTGVFWLLILLSDQVLQIVGLPVIKQLIRQAPVVWGLSGLMLGLGLAVVHELRAYISPFLALRLLRLMLPLVLVVSAIFLVAAPIKGLSNLFGSLSPAALLMAMAFAAVSLITAIVDADDDTAASSRVLTLSARLMALLLPLVGGLAAVAVGQRVAQYGWTPDRLAAAVLAGLVLAYGVLYGAAVLGRAGWMARIRRANVLMALATIGLAGLWLSPVLNAERIAANSQVFRFEAGKVGPEALDLWAIRHDWGRAGRMAMAHLSDPAHPRAEELAAPLRWLAESNSRRQWENAARETANRRLSDRIREVLPVFPAGEHLPEGAMRGGAFSRNLFEACERTTIGGNMGCLAWVADFSPSRPGKEILYLYLRANGRVIFEGRDRENDYIFVTSSGKNGGVEVEPGLIDRISSGALELSDTPNGFLLIGESVIFLGKD